MNENIKWVEFKRTDPIEAEIIRGKLESAGIEVYLSQEAYGKLAAITVDGLGETKVLIPEDKLEEAKRIISE